LQSPSREPSTGSSLKTRADGGMAEIPGAGLAEALVSMLGPHLTLLVVSLLPVIEPRYALLIGTLILGLPLWEAFLVSALGVVILSIVLPRFFSLLIRSAEEGLLARVPGASRLMEKLERRSLERVREKYEKYEILGLVIFVAVPLPMTGIYTGALAGVLLGLSPEKNTLAVMAGGFISIIITGASAGIIQLSFY